MLVISRVLFLFVYNFVVYCLYQVSSFDRYYLIVWVICRYYFEDLEGDHHDRPAGKVPCAIALSKEFLSHVSSPCFAKNQKIEVAFLF